MKNHHWIKFLPILLCFVLLYTKTYAQTNLSPMTLETFGKNRVQYKDFNWRVLRTSNFDIYYYDFGKRLADFTTRFLETEFDEITDALGYTPYFKTRIFVYNSISDLQQSNVGIDNNNIVIGGQTDFFKSIIEIPFTGSEVEFKQELRLGLSQMLIREMMFGGTLKEMLQSSYLGKFNEWFILGAAQYVSEGWSEEMDDYMRDFFKRRGTKKPGFLSEQEAVIVGQSVWNYIAEKYGKNTISNILNLARIIRNERKSIASTLGINQYKSFLKDWERYYTQMADIVYENNETPEYEFKVKRRNRKGFHYNQVKVSPDGKYMAYSQNKNGKYKIIVKTLIGKNKTKVLLRKGYNAVGQRYDFDLPLLSWQNNTNLGITYMKKGAPQLSIINVENKKSQYERAWEYFNHISGFDFSDNGEWMIISADRKGKIRFKTGQSDLYIFNLEEKTLDKITDDWFDDLDPVFLPNSNTSFAFSSNRPTDSLQTTLIKNRGNFSTEYKNYDLFIFDVTQSSNEVERVAYSIGNETKPSFLDENTVLFLSDETGINQLYSFNRQTRKTKQHTNYRHSLRDYGQHQTTGLLAFKMLDRGKENIYVLKNFDFESSTYSNKTARQQILETKKPIKINKPTRIDTTFNRVEPKITEVYGPDEIDTDNYEFDSEILKKEDGNIKPSPKSVLELAKQANKSKLKVKGPYEYFPRFRAENVVTSPQIDPLRGTGLVINLSSSEMLENHKIDAGVFFLFDLRNSSFYADYRFLGKRIDYELRYNRDVLAFNNSQVLEDYALNQLKATISYPITNLLRVSISPFWASTIYHNKIDRAIGGSPPLISWPSNRVHYAGARLELNYDNTKVNGMNMIKGTRVKVFFEQYQGIAGDVYQTFNDYLENQNLVKAGDRSFNQFSIDFRNYFPLHKDIIFATRIAYGTFGGKSPKSYMLGGMDNWLFNQTDPGDGENNPLNLESTVDNSDLLFNRFVTNMRGFNYNKLSGSNFLLANMEVRFPIVKYLFGKRVNNNFFKNLQLVAFGDVGSAWSGISPFNRENSINTRSGSDGGSFFFTVNNFKDPFLQSYGLGVRSILFGYYVKLDVAWGIENRVIPDDPKYHLTFGYDF